MEIKFPFCSNILSKVSPVSSILLFLEKKEIFIHIYIVKIIVY